MTLTEAALRYNRITIAGLLVVLLGALYSYLTISRAEDPAVTVRVAQIVTYLPGATPERVEPLVTKPLEAAVMEMPELDVVESTSRAGVSILRVELRPQVEDVQASWDKLRRKITDARRALPDEALPPIVNDEFGDVFGIMLSLTGEGFDQAELKEVADDVHDRLLLLDDVAKVTLHGYAEERIFLEYREARLAELGVSPQELARLLAARNIVLPGGAIRSDDERLVVEPTGNFTHIDDIRDALVPLPGGSLVPLGTLLEVRHGYADPPRTRYHGSGHQGLAIAVAMREGGNILDLGERVEAVITRLEQTLPIGLALEVLTDQPERVEVRINEFLINLLQAVVLVCVVMLLFLGLRTGLIVASLVPMTILACLALMGVFDIGLHQVSLGALIISLGMLVDNAIVMVESTQVSAREGRSVREAALASASELRFPLLTASLTTSAAFLPQFLAVSDVGEYTRSLFQVVTITLLASWVLSLTMIPLLCVAFLRVKNPSTQRRGDEDPRQASTAQRPGLGERLATAAFDHYQRILLVLLRHRLVTLAVVAALMGLAWLGFGQLPKIFFPQAERTLVTVELRLPYSAPIERTRSVVEEIEAFLAGELAAERDANGEWTRDGVDRWGSFIGFGGERYIINHAPEPPSPEYAFLLLQANRWQAVDEVIERLEAWLDRRFPDLHASIASTSFGPPVTVPLSVRLSGDDEQELREIAEGVRQKVASLPGTRNVRDDWGPWIKRLRIDVDPARALRAGVTERDVAISLQTALSGLQVGTFRDDDTLVPIELRNLHGETRTPDALDGITVLPAEGGEGVPLAQVAAVELDWGPARILRRDRFLTLAVEAELAEGVTAAEVVATLRPWLAEQQADWPAGFFHEFGGEVESSRIAMESIAAKLPIGAAVILLLLVAQFNSLRRPLIILATIPMALIGVVLGLTLTGSYFGIMTFLGVVSLAGIVINNGIVLIQRIDREARDGMRPQQAILEAGRRRLRPVAMSTLTTSGGLVPLWLGGGLLWAPMAIAIIFGLLVASVLTLCIVPVLYSLLMRVPFDEDDAPPQEGEHRRDSGASTVSG
ncbi:efflux RND transporter permease subunit [Halomonas lysinitropha]|uniref:Cobalt-zinc-cadmium resistance protein CzcA n=1 Tax=Halomonas lysinitropha TaxID=2607506 RepID=A0A5K1IA96_9GAMM|nr:efflux RND transporter permease subunit [Halomonas lysinitropha]VVZ97427.1 Cobalt-zinc-cadmium resistance protein CzcA [Halomonas lysinitropha]